MAIRDLFKKIWKLSAEKEKLTKRLLFNEERLQKIDDELKQTQYTIVKENLTNYVVDFQILYKRFPEVAERLLKENEVISKLSICDKKFKWQKAVLEVFACYKSEGLLLCNDPSRCENCEGKKIKIIQV